MGYVDHSDAPRLPMDLNVELASALRTIRDPRWKTLEEFDRAASRLAAAGLIDAVDGGGVASVNRVVEAGRSDLIPSLAKHGAYMSHLYAGCHSPLMTAALDGDAAMVKALLSAGSDPLLSGRDGGTPLLFAVLGQSAECVSLLAAAGCPLDQPNAKGETPLGNAMVYGFDQAVALLIRCGARASNMRDSGPQTPLFFAASNGYSTACSILLAEGASANERDELGRTPLMAASAAGQTGCIRALLPSSDAWAADSAGRTALDLCLPEAKLAFEPLLRARARIAIAQASARARAASAARPSRLSSK